MRHALRPYVTAGVALVGAGMVAVAPAAPALSAVHLSPDVALTAVDLSDINFTQAWTDAFDTAKTNFDTLQAASKDAGEALSTALQHADFSKLDPTQLSDALSFLGGDQKNFIIPMSGFALDSTDGLGHGFVFPILTAPPDAGAGIPDGGVLVANDLKDLVPLVNFAASPISGEIWGALSPGLAPLVSLINSFEAISADLSTAGGHVADTTAALQEMVNIPANMVNGLLNGDTLDLTPLIPTLTSLLPESLTKSLDLSALSLAFGGLLDPGHTLGELNPEPGALSGADGVGGSLFNALGLSASVGGFPLTVDGFGVGPGGAMTMIENIFTSWLDGSLPAVDVPAP
ncbi:outer membrane porin GjpA [Mycobacterium sp. M1]|uniref:Outer membrane porin GjpA n=1 Tax=Mycolicibacter acidiphilus TaxID=2835306 RepID=A0ABS5RR43_9MYCO|nr:outer membrane porin GjpA [Mycolicibacter acidiphilus]MBS9536049.1 outer membrane porin GjpA [Mycolicibacter acidiphilus]